MIGADGTQRALKALVWQAALRLPSNHNEKWIQKCSKHFVPRPVRSPLPL